MTMEKNDICSSTMVYPDIAKSSVEVGRDNVKKIFIISSAVVIGLALILGIILLGIYLTGQNKSYTETQKMISWKDKTGMFISEKMTVNTETNEEAFETQKISVVHDFDKGLTVVKILKQNNDHGCYLTTLNTSGLLNPAEMEDVISSKQGNLPKYKGPGKVAKKKAGLNKYLFSVWVPVLKDLLVTELNFNVTTVAITNRNFLSTKSKKMCEGFTIFWMIQTNDDGKQNAERKRRSVVPMFSELLLVNHKYPHIINVRGMGVK